MLLSCAIVHIFLSFEYGDKLENEILLRLTLLGSYCRAMKTKGMVFRYTWAYSKEDTLGHTRRPVVTS